MTFTVTLDSAVAVGFTVTPSFTDVTARSGVDYTQNTTAITFAGTAGETRTFTVATTEDAYQEADETFTVGLSVSAASLSVGAPGTATGTILDDGDTTTNSPPVIKPLNIRHYDFQYQTILPWCIKVHDGDGDDVAVTVTGLPQGLSHSDSDSCSGGTVSGTVMPNTHRIPARRDNAFIVKINADDGVNAVVTHSFNYFVMWGRPHITSPGDKTYQQGERIAAFDIVVDADEKYKEVELTGLPDSLSYESASEQVTGTVDANAEIKDYTVTITADGDGPGWLSPVTDTFTIAVISSRPDVQISGPADAQNGAFDVTITFSEPVTGFEKGDVTVDNGTATALSGSGSSYTATITPTASGTVTVDVAENVAEDGASNGNTAASRYSVEADLDAPTVSITGPTASQSDSFDVTITFTESVTGFEQEEVTVGNGAATALSGSGASYTATITPTASGTLTVDVAENVAADGAGNGNTAADQFTVPVDLTRPTVVISCPTVTQTGAFDAGIAFSETVTGFEQAEATVGNGTVTALTGSGASYTATITPAATGTLTVDVAENVAVDGEGHGNLAAQRCRVQVNLDDPKLTIFDESASEGDSMTFKVTLDKDVPGGFTVTPSFTDVTATKGTDYTENTAALSFKGTAGEEQTFTVATIEDAANEPDETFTVGLSVSGTSLAVTDTEIATGTITDDDVLQRPGVTIADEIAAEGDSLTFTMTLNNAVSGGFALTPDFTDLTATKGTDYTAKTAVIKFDGTAGEKQTLTVETVDDDVAESNEVFEVSLSVSGTTAKVKAIEAKGLIVDDDAAAVTIADASAEEGDSITFTVTLDQAVTDGLTVTPSFTDVTATEGTDYTENTTGLSFTGTAGETQSFTVATTEDTGVESDETFTVSLTVSDTSETVTATDIARGTITNDDGEAALTIADASAEEGDSITFTVTLDKAVQGGLTVTPSFTDVTATVGTDYTENTTALSFTGTAGETQTFTVTTTEDRVVEEDETFTVSLNVSDTSATVSATDTATGTITDDDGAPSRGTSVVTIASASAAEGESLTFTVTLNLAVQGGLTVTPSFTDVTTTKGTDYTENTAALSFTGTTGEEQTITVATTEDSAVEEDETFTVSLSVSDAPSGVTVGDPATGTITDDDAPAVMIADASAAEGDSLTFTLTLDKAVQGGLTVTPSFTDVTATVGTDYTENTTALSFTGTAGETQTFTVTTTEDRVVEEDETFTVSLNVSDTSATVSATDTATGTITDDDGGTTGSNATVTIANASAVEGDSLTFTVTLNLAVQGGLTVTPSFTDVTTTKGTDYTENTAALSFTGTTGEEQTITVATTEDSAVEEDETFTVSLSVSDAPSGVTVGDPGTGTIIDDDGGTTGNNATVTIANASAVEGDSLTFTVTLNLAVQGGMTVTPSFSDGTATEGADYTKNTAKFSFTGTAGETQTITVATTEDEVVENDETFTVSLGVSNAPSGVTVGDPATGTITDDDGGTTGSNATVTIANASAVEGESLTFAATLNRAVQGGLTVTPSFADGTAVADSDYTANVEALSFVGTLGETQTIVVETVEDAAVETEETFTVSLSVSNAPSGVTVGDPATGTISDDDGAEPAVTVADASTGEGDPMTFTVTLNQVVQGGLTVTPSFSDGTATESTDYTADPVPLSFTGTAGEQQTITVETVEDAVVEADETFTVSLAVSGASTTVTATDTATGTITDDDGGTTGGNATVTIANASVVEGEALTFTVKLNQAVQEGLTVTPSFSDGTATESTDYTANPVPLSFTGTAGEQQTITVETVEDTVVEADETFTVSLSVSNAPSGVTVGNSATGTISDDDGATGGTPTVTIANASAVEGDSLTFTAKLNQAVQGGLTVTPGFSDGTAFGGTDYTENTAAIRFTGTAGETQTFTVATTEDEVVEADETFTASLSVSNAPSGVTVGDSATGTITDDDGRATGGTPAVTIANASAVEGESLTFTVTLNQAVQGGLTVTPGFSDGTVTPGFSDGTAVRGTDYTANRAALGFTGTAAEEQTFTVETIEDEVVEDDETFTVSLNVSNAPSGVTAGGPATGTITNDDGGGGKNNGKDTGKNHAPVAVDDSITVLRGGSISLLSNEYRSSYIVNREEYPAGRTEEPPDDTNNDGDQLQSPLFNFFPQASVLANDSDLEDGFDQLSVELITSPDHGHLTLNRDGTFTFVHDGSRGSHEDRFTYQVRDSHGALSNIATVKIMVIGLNAGPEGEPIPDQVLTLGSDGTVDVASYFTDPDGDPLSYDARASDGSSTVEVNLLDSQVVLTPVAIASTRITVTARDPEGLSAEQSFGVTVESVQDRSSRLLELSLAAFGRTVASQAVDAIGGRFEVSSRESHANFGGRRLDVETASDDQDRSRVAEWLQTATSLLGTESLGSDSLTRTPAAGRPVPGQWDVAGRQAKTQTGLSSGGGLSGGSGAGGFGAGSLPLATGQNGFNRLSSRNLMSNSSFQFAPDGDSSQGSNWMLWGQGVRSSLHGQPQPDMGLDGRVGAAYLGADRRWGAKALVGLAASHSVGVLDFANGGNGGNDLEVGARLTSALPYLKWSPRPGFDLWGLMGYGRGAAEVEVEGDSVEMGIDVRLAALGGRSDLTRLGAVDLALKADAFAVSVGSEAVGGLKAVNGHTQRARLMLEGRTDWALSSNSRLTPSLEVGARMDGGDAETGIGAELAGGASFANRRLGLVVEARGHWLVAHQDRNFRERGARLTVRLDPGADGKGWGFSLAPLWGNTSGGADALWRSEQMPVGRNRTEEQTGVHLRPNRTQADLSYGLETWGGRGRLGPFAKMDLEGLDSPRLGGGLRLEVPGASKSISEMVADGLRLELFGDYRRRRPDPAAGLSAGPSGSPDYRIGISLVLNF